jgi:2,4-dienoyl-CoA reductase-like NADH-dependent reductase (Old Yellow Enzyme family)
MIGPTTDRNLQLSPIGQYSSKDGMFTPWHMAHRTSTPTSLFSCQALLTAGVVGGIITRGPGLSVIESTAVAPTGRITPHDAGLWKDEHIAPLKQICDFAHSQNQKVAIQLTHAGRKASSVAPWLHPGHAASPIDGGWPDAVVAPSAIPYNELYPHPREITVAEIKAVMVAFADAACRALAAGIDAIVIHGAHGYLISGFLSPASNSRTDEYGGSFENRTRFALEVVDAIRSVIPAGMPLFLR